MYWYVSEYNYGGGGGAAATGAPAGLVFDYNRVMTVNAFIR